jgi:nicotinamide phosphoribosyltransferase
MEYLTKPITSKDVDEANNILTSHGLPFNVDGWKRIVNYHDGYLPIRIESLPEGMPIPVGTTQLQIRNTDTELPWVTSYIETALLRAIWYPSTVATISREIKKIIKKSLELSSDSPDEQINFKLHDFGARGVSSDESAMLGGMAHLINFMGTDTLSAIMGAKKYYNCEMAGFSIPAAEHSTITSWGKENESMAYKNMLDKFAKPSSLVAVVSDSYDIYKAANNIWGSELLVQIVNSGATVVIRPDSGHPPSVIMNLLNILSERFGFTANKKGFKVLHPSIRLIQGDGIDYDMINLILREMNNKGWSTDNIAFGMGGALLQKVNRDTFKYAMKTNAMHDGVKWNDVYKDPITDSGKTSKKGILAVVKSENTLQNIRKENLLYDKNLLDEVFCNGEITKTYTFDSIRLNAIV